MGKWGSKEEKKGSRQYFYPACNKDPQIIYHLSVLFILMKAVKLITASTAISSKLDRLYKRKTL